MPSRVTLLLGKPPRPGTLLAEVADELETRGLTVTVRLPHEEPVEAADLAAESLVVHRGLNGSVTSVLGELHHRGVPLCNPWPADRLLRDRRSWQAALAAAEVPLPPSITVERWPDVLARAGTQQVVAKAFAGPGRGTQVVTGTGRTLPRDAPFPGPYLVEQRLPADGTDRKLYLAGRVVRGLLKASTLEGRHTTSGTPFEPDAVQVDLALRVQRALGAHLIGVDLLHTPTGPVVVDVNGFPGFRGVPGAVPLVTEHILEHVAGPSAG
ncbi:ATP-grasp domain-containing protein [Georgenia sunbinii]|uniref:ATP-grasp domain-containing protein n=1 Tax=Georgenia sunbinii TaxID=3117728 RepID=UPI002F263FD0